MLKMAANHSDRSIRQMKGNEKEETPRTSGFCSGGYRTPITKGGESKIVRNRYSCCADCRRTV